jgi:hypothetical protein
MDSDKLHSDVIQVRNTEVNLGWIRNTFYSGFNSAIFWLLVSRLRPGTFRYTALCIGGMALSVFWLITAIRSRAWMTYWHSCLGKLETAEMDVTHVSVFAGPAFDKMDKKTDPQPRDAQVTHWNYRVRLVRLIHLLAQPYQSARSKKFLYHPQEDVMKETGKKKRKWSKSLWICIAIGCILIFSAIIGNPAPQFVLARIFCAVFGVGAIGAGFMIRHDLREIDEQYGPGHWPGT